MLTRDGVSSRAARLFPCTCARDIHIHPFDVDAERRHWIRAREARRAARGQSISRLQQATSAAVSTLLKVMVDPSTPPSTKVRAADSVLDRSTKAIELEDILVRLTALETAAEESRK